GYWSDLRARPQVQWSRSRRCVDQGGLVHVVRRPHCEAAGVVTRMFERRISLLLAALVVFLGSAALWNAFVRPAPRSSPSATPSQPPAAARDNTAPATPTAPASRPAQPPPLAASGPSYIVLLARSGIRPRIRASAGLTSPYQLVAASSDV